MGFWCLGLYCLLVFKYDWKLQTNRGIYESRIIDTTEENEGGIFRHGNIERCCVGNNCKVAALIHELRLVTWRNCTLETVPEPALSLLLNSASNEGA